MINFTMIFELIFNILIIYNSRFNRFTCFFFFRVRISLYISHNQCNIDDLFQVDLCTPELVITK